MRQSENVQYDIPAALCSQNNDLSSSSFPLFSNSFFFLLQITMFSIVRFGNAIIISLILPKKIIRSFSRSYANPQRKIKKLEEYRLKIYTDKNRLKNWKEPTTQIENTIIVV